MLNDRNFFKAQAEYEAKLLSPFDYLPQTDEELEEDADYKEYLEVWWL